MNISAKKRILIVCAHLGPAVCGLGGFPTAAGAQTAVSLPASGAISVAVSAMPSPAVLTDAELEKRVKTALHADPYFYDEHVNVSVERGAVVLSGLVFSDEDLQDAIRIARTAAGNRPVIDNLSINDGRRR